RRGGPEAQHAVRHRIERHVELERRHRTGPIGEPRARLPRDRPAAPLQPLDARPHVPAQRVERPFQAHEHSGRTRERLDTAIVRTARTGAAPESTVTSPRAVNVSNDAGARASQLARSRSRARSVKSRTPWPAAPAPSSSTPSPCTLPPPEWSAAWVSSCGSGPASFTVPATAPESGSVGKLPLSPSNDRESATTSAYTPSVSLRPSRRTVPVSRLGASVPSRCSSVPVNCAFFNGPLKV